GLDEGRGRHPDRPRERGGEGGDRDPAANGHLDRCPHQRARLGQTEDGALPEAEAHGEQPAGPGGEAEPPGEGEPGERDEEADRLPDDDEAHPAREAEGPLRRHARGGSSTARSPRASSSATIRAWSSSSMTNLRRHTA